MKPISFENAERYMLRAVYKTRDHAKAALRRRWSRYVIVEQYAVQKVSEGWWRIVPDPDGFEAAADRANTPTQRAILRRTGILKIK